MCKKMAKNCQIFSWFPHTTKPVCHRPPPPRLFYSRATPPFMVISQPSRLQPIPQQVQASARFTYCCCCRIDRRPALGAVLIPTSEFPPVKNCQNATRGIRGPNGVSVSRLTLSQICPAERATTLARFTSSAGYKMFAKSSYETSLRCWSLRISVSDACALRDLPTWPATTTAVRGRTTESAALAHRPARPTNENDRKHAHDSNARHCLYSLPKPQNK